MVLWGAHAALADEAAPKKAALPLPAPIRFIGKYYFSWAGVHLGDLELSIDEKAESYTLRLAVTTAGLVNWFSRHESDTTVTGIRAKDHYQPLHYESRYKTKNKPRHILLAFDAQGKVTQELNEPPENHALRPEVPPALKDGAYDPLTTLLVLRSGVLSFPAFDAKRLYRVKADPAESDSFTILDKETETEGYILSRTPLAGMTDKENKEYANGEPPLKFYLGKFDKRIPVTMSMPILMGSVKGILIKECNTWDECKIK